eukprot:TRINITY_DN88050_c0_g1_i1.p1 TRINITY_DN88050_c0_g1~~TRINITY_DN88050_c0_g1_i1.p1  ORF type:complete len:284 (-),score=72.26 TRINITY_DN88050_c0_g1_i1:139-990(-)
MGGKEVIKRDFDVILAEDEEMFREMAETVLKRVGIPSERLHVVENGLEAIEVLDQIQDKGTPVIMLLDLRMPNLDGQECAKRVKDEAQQGIRRTTPFTVCCSALVREVTKNPEGFDMEIPKSFGEAQMLQCLADGYEWCISKGGARDSGASAAGGGGNASAGDGKIDVIVADPEAICRMAMMANLGHFAECIEDPIEIEEEEELPEALQNADRANNGRPLLLLLSIPEWYQAKPSMKRKPFVVGTQGEGDESVCHEVLPGLYEQSDIERVLDECKKWHANGCK